jgi:hypothetical protein
MKELFEAVFSVQSVPKRYEEDLRDKRVSFEPVKGVSLELAVRRDLSQSARNKPGSRGTSAVGSRCQATW